MQTSIDIPASSFQPPAVIKPRVLKVARQLSRCCPGLGHIYAGDIRRGLLFLAGVDLPIVLGAWALVAPWGNIQLVIAFWIIAFALSTWATIDVKKTVLATRADYRMKDYNHWTAYLVIGVIPTLAVAMATAVAIMTTLSQPLAIASDLPRIGVTKGDRIVEWKAAYKEAKPAKGDYVSFRRTIGGDLFIGRIAALPGDTVTLPGGPHVIPERSIAITRGEEAGGPETYEIISEMALAGKLVYRCWPPTRLGTLGGPEKVRE